MLMRVCWCCCQNVERGLVLPPRIAPVQVDIIPIMQKKEGVLDKAYEVKETLAKAKRIAAGLMALGVQKGEKVSYLSEGRAPV